MKAVLMEQGHLIGFSKSPKLGLSKLDQERHWYHYAVREATLHGFSPEEVMEYITNTYINMQACILLCILYKYKVMSI